MHCIQYLSQCAECLCACTVEPVSAPLGFKVFFSPIWLLVENLLMIIKANDETDDETDDI